MELWETPYPASRQPVLAPHGMVATSQPLAAQAGLSMLQAGGNAVDAAIATAIALTVLEPTSNGIGGDAFAIVYDPHAKPRYSFFNGAGCSPALLTPELVQQRTGGTTIPNHGWLPVTVPGAPRLWSDMHATGRLPFEQLFGPAIAYARDGFPVSPLTARGWARSAEVYANLPLEIRESWQATFLQAGEAPKAGSTWRCPNQVATLEELAATRCDSLYTGRLAADLVRFAQQTGGLVTAEDLAQHVRVRIRGLSSKLESTEVSILELGYPTQGMVAFEACYSLWDEQGVNLDPDDPNSWHLGIEAIKAAFVAVKPVIADYPSPPEFPLELSLSPDGIGQPLPSVATDPGPIRARPGGTVYLCTADADGMMVSFIQSNYMGFGSGLVVPGTGIALQNRGACFDPDPSHPNGVGPGKRPYHTIIPAFLSRGQEPIGPFGIMGGHMQPQAHVQFFGRILAGWHVQAALDAPRWRWDEGKTVAVEATTPPHIVDGLRARGHEVRIEPFGGGFGRGQAIFRLPEGGYIGGSDARGDGCAVGY